MIDSRKLISIALAIFVVGVAGGCASNSEGASPPVAEEQERVDLTGEWEQNNDGAEGMADHVATIVDDTMTIYWLNDEGTRSLYWVGDVDIPEESTDSFDWVSVRDKSKTDSALLASQNDDKTFTFRKGIISYETGALGMSWIVELKQTSTTPAAAPKDPSSDYEVTIDGATFGSDRQGNSVIIVDFDFTNNSGKSQSFNWAVTSQAFQDGVALDDFVLMDGIDSSLQNSDIQPGITLNLQKAFKLRNETQVSIEVRDEIANTVLATQDFSVDQ